MLRTPAARAGTVLRVDAEDAVELWRATARRRRHAASRRPAQCRPARDHRHAALVAGRERTMRSLFSGLPAAPRGAAHGAVGGSNHRTRGGAGPRYQPGSAVPGTPRAIASRNARVASSVIGLPLISRPDAPAAGTLVWLQPCISPAGFMAFCARLFTRRPEKTPAIWINGQTKQVACPHSHRENIFVPASGVAIFVRAMDAIFRDCKTSLLDQQCVGFGMVMRTTSSIPGH